MDLLDERDEEGSERGWIMDRDRYFKGLSLAFSTMYTWTCLRAFVESDGGELPSAGVSLMRRV
ncbi:hypothetical protein TWF730_006678 [Orbilia blumenaviensis]|uniref:Uncharacterized protein n=1 Tax=Orbilia blumenaviensis TaxID=1796055 RepID=A0AAV9VEY6_9PEZI